MNLEIIAQKPTTTTHLTPILFIHGAWHSAVGWQKNTMPYFAANGYQAYALSLRGHGKSEGKVQWCSAKDYVVDVRQVASHIEAETGQHPILMGHSMGGYITQKYLEKYPAPAAILLASLPTRGLIGFTLRYSRRHPLTMLIHMLTMDAYRIIKNFDDARDLLFTDAVPETQAREFWQELGQESYRIETEMLLNLPRPAKIKTPMLVVGAEKDNFFSQGEIRGTARAYQTEAAFFPGGHNLMIEPGWEKVADYIMGWLHEHGF
ncbi:MAG: alpha/beta fold hydrolase [Chloroflexi bacterium]|nr:alpha/beta fold hydrolase [Chloroflexota bacterium]